MTALSLSSMWAVGRYERAQDFALAAAELGYSAIEFNYEAPQAWFEEADLALPISSLHNPCPMVRTSSGRWSQELSYGALDDSERTEAVKLCRQTLDHASRLGARAVVLHVATVPVDMALQARLKSLWDAGRAASDEFLTVRDSLRQARNALAEPHVRQAARSVRELSLHAADRNVVLGLETRYNLYEIPGLDEMDELLDAGRDGLVGYWHDVGHAELQDRLAFAGHAQWLERFGRKMVGCHLHELQGLRDHQAVGQGEMAWELVSKHLPAGVIRVCEFDRRNEPAWVKGAVGLLRDHGILGLAS